jgi:ubiquinone/menaquinone biosynthesis C-methylase UbiE
MSNTLLPNHSLKEDNRAYWSRRAESFDLSAGHRIEEQVEAPEWRRLFRAALGDLTGRAVLDVACGTGEISRLLLSMGAHVTGVDFAEPMLARARAKNAAAGKRYRAVLGDAESLALEESGRYDAVVTRHLVWTLTDPHAAFAQWHRVLKPGGRLLVVDGNWVEVSPLGRVMRALATRLGGESRHRQGDDGAEHARILAQVHYAAGLTPARLAEDLARHGFTHIRRHGMERVYWLGMRHAPFAERLRLCAPHRFALSAEAGGRG